jgi:hypothetical protein
VLDDYVARLKRAGFKSVRVEKHPDAARKMLEVSITWGGAISVHTANPETAGRGDGSAGSALAGPGAVAESGVVGHGVMLPIGNQILEPLLFLDQLFQS